MILELRIRNLAIIEDLDVRFGPGLNVLTGETGAGKSIVLGAIDLILGGKASAEQIRTGADEAEVEALIDLSQAAAARKRLKDADLEQGDELVIRRVIGRSGKNRVFINGRMAQLNLLKSLAEDLIAVYGQHEHQKLLRPEVHLEILDEFGHLAGLRDDVEAAYRKASALRSELDGLKSDEMERARRLDFLRFLARRGGGAEDQARRDPERAGPAGTGGRRRRRALFRRRVDPREPVAALQSVRGRGRDRAGIFARFGPYPSSMCNCRGSGCGIAEP